MSIEEVRSLVAERQRYESWLQALEAKRGETPARVFERVRSDYTSRRDSVAARISEHETMLEALTTELQTRASALDTRLGELEEDRAEAMLRTAVGEFDGERWEQVRRDVESNIEQLNIERTGLRSELDDARALLSSARANIQAVVEPPAPTAPQAAPEPPAYQEPEVSASAPSSAPVAVASAAQDEEEPTTSDAELDDMLSMLDAPEAARTNSVPRTSGRMPAIEDQDAKVSDIDLLMIDTDDASVSAAGRDDMLDVLPVSNDAQSSAGASPSHNANPPAAPASDDAFDDLAFLRSVVDPTSNGAHSNNGSTRAAGVTEQQKTLRCTECGTMNLPTEWYCERCGGELAAF